MENKEEKVVTPATDENVRRYIDVDKIDDSFAQDKVNYNGKVNGLRVLIIILMILGFPVLTLIGGFYALNAVSTARKPKDVKNTAIVYLIVGIILLIACAPEIIFIGDLIPRICLPTYTALAAIISFIVSVLCFGFTDSDCTPPVLDKIIGKQENVITLSHVDIGYKQGNDLRKVVSDFNLSIKRGEIFGLVGESGSGKTTVGRSIMRIVPTLDGEIRYNGHKINGKITAAREKELKTKIQMIFQDPSASLNDRANVDYIVSEGLRAFHLYENEEDRMEKVDQMMKRVGLRPEHLRRYPHEFSGGQRQRIGIARCMVMNPEVIIADEPISALDVSIRAQVLNLIKEFQKESNMTVIFIAHDLSVVKYISDRIGVIYGGRLVELTTANRLFEMPLHPYTKSLLSAVPIPDPQVERKKKIISYNPFAHGYKWDDVPDFYEVEPGHYVRCNKKELAQYKAIIANEGKEAK